MHYDLRLSVALQMTPANGIGALINYSRPIDKYTRFLLYNYYSRTEYFEDDEFTGFSKAKSRKPDTLATHVIVFINWGIDAVILLQLPADDEQVQAIDYALENIELNKMRTAWRNLKEMYTNEIHRVRNLVLGIRRGEIDQTKIPNELSNDQVETMTKKINEFTNYLNTMDKKEQLIKDLTEKQFIYQNAIDRDIQYDDDRQTLERKLLADAKHTSIICSNDHLYKTNRSQWYTLCGQLLKEHEENPELQLIYVDFSYCLCKLHDIIILPATEKKNNATLTPPVTTPPQERPTSDKSLNILLLGESGVGKSTFINAFVNYLKFDKLKQAEKNPVVLIPVSFAITIDDNFTEQVVKFEGNDTLSNEDHDNLGHSVTQHCKSYVFTLKDGNHHGRKLRIIDTPGIGDTHGSGQDDAMRNILRNLILWNARSSKVYIELYPKIIKGTTAICLKCSHDFAQVADFWITTYGLHIFHNRCRTCRCDPSDHYPIDYELGYKRCDDLASNSEKSMTQILDDLYQTSAGFANFLVGASGTSNNDPF
ncbi:unnamed protein product, partial [Rotaria sp. Silwood1]